MLKKCINCGAILHGNICEYCGTEYSDNGISATFNEGDYMGELKISNETINVYIAQADIMHPDIFEYGDKNGMLRRDITPPKRKFTLVEF